MFLHCAEYVQSGIGGGVRMGSGDPTTTLQERVSLTVAHDCYDVSIAMDLRDALFEEATSFREQADKDYIAARSCYRMNLREQFLWASLQACEKYLKGTLLFNEKGARYDPADKKGKTKFRHNLTRLFEVAREIGDLPLDKPVWLPEFLGYLTIFGNNRYLSKATYARGDELRRLDEVVWVLRRVCQNFEWTPEIKGSPPRNLRPVLLAQLTRLENRKNPAVYRPFGKSGGFLEKKLQSPIRDPARQALVWNNMFFGKRQRHRLSYAHFSSSENPPQTRQWFSEPAIADNIGRYVGP